MHLLHGQSDSREHGDRDILPIPGITDEDRTPWFLVLIHCHLTGDSPSDLRTFEPWSEKFFQNDLFRGRYTPSLLLIHLHLLYFNAPKNWAPSTPEGGEEGVEGSV